MIEQDFSDAELPATIDCPECGAVNDFAERFCIDCGVSLAALRRKLKQSAAAAAAAAAVAGVDLGGVEPARGEPARGEPARGEPARGEPARGEPDRGDLEQQPPPTPKPRPATVSTPRREARAERREELAARRETWSQARSQRRVVAGVVVAVLVVALGWLGYAQLIADDARAETRVEAPPPEPVSLESRVEQFRAAWRRDDAEAVKGMMKSGPRALHWQAIEKILAREGWDLNLPRISEPEFGRRTRHQALVDFELERGRLRTRWEVAGHTWMLDMLTFRGLR